MTAEIESQAVAKIPTLSPAVPSASSVRLDARAEAEISGDVLVRDTRHDAPVVVTPTAPVTPKPSSETPPWPPQTLPDTSRVPPTAASMGVLPPLDESTTLALEVLKQKRRELEAAKGGFVSLPGPEAKRVTVSQLLDGLLTEYELHGRRSIKGVTSHLKRVREELGEVRAVDLRLKHLTEYQVARSQADAAGGTINRELSLLRRSVRRFLEDQKLAMPRVAALPENVREGFFTKDEVTTLVKHLPEDLRDFTWFAFLTGWRETPGPVHVVARTRTCDSWIVEGTPPAATRLSAEDPGDHGARRPAC